MYPIPTVFDKFIKSIFNLIPNINFCFVTINLHLYMHFCKTLPIKTRIIGNIKKSYIFFSATTMW